MMPAMRAPRSLAALLLVAQILAACNAPAPAAVVLPTVTLEPTATLVPTPEPTPTPAASTILDDAAIALRDGDWDSASSLYRQALQAATDPGDQAQADLGLATSLLSAGKAAEAIEALTAFLARYPDDARAATATFLRGQAREQLGLIAEAVQDYEAYVAQRPGLVDGFVWEKVGDLRRTLGAPMQAVTDYRNALAAPRLGGDATLHVKIGRALMEANDPDAALAEYDALALATSDGTLLATLNYLSGLALEDKGDPDAAQARYLDSVQRFPDAYDAYSGLVRLVDMDVPVDPYLRGYIDYRPAPSRPRSLRWTWRSPTLPRQPPTTTARSAGWSSATCTAPSRTCAPSS
jgi:tetratricopeptide (TPR) repeat protein